MNQTNVKQNKNTLSSIIAFLVYIGVIVAMSLCFFLIPVSSFTKYKLDVFCSNCTIDSASEFHGKYLSNETVSITFKPDLHCGLPNDVNAMIGDEHLTKDTDYTYSADTGEMSIKIKGNTSVSIAAPCNVLSFDVELPAHSSFDVGFDYNKEPVLNETSYPGIVDWGDGTQDNKSSHHFDEMNEKRNYTVSIYDYSYDYFSFSNVSSKKYIKSVFIPTNVSQIEERCFANFTGLSSVEFANDSKLTSISDFAFLRCSLSSVTLPKGLMHIGDSAFSNCALLKTITIPNSVTSIGHSAFADCSKMEEIAFERGSQLTTIGDFAFSDSGLSSITIPDGVTSIGEGAFSMCEKLASITIPNSVTSIGDYALFGCSSLNLLIIPKSVTHMGSLAMSIGKEPEESEEAEEVPTPYIFCEIGAKPQTWENNWTTKTSVVYWGAVDVGANDDYTYVIQNFDGKQAVSLMSYISESDPVDIVIPSTIDVNGIPTPVIGIGDNIFNKCSTLTSVYIPNSVTTIGANAFNNCTNLKTLTFEEGVRLTYIGDYAFNNVSMVTDKPIITISKNMTYIGDYAFYGTRFKFTLEEGNRLTYIGDYALLQAEFTSPASFIFSDNMTSIGEYAFCYCNNITSVTIPKSVTSIGHEAFYNCKQLETVTFEPGIQLTSINDYVFGGTTALKSITIPSTVTSIGYNAFSGSGLTSISIHNGITSIGEGAFSSCKQLETVTFEPGIQLTSINNRIFSNTTALKSITIPNTVTSIGNDAFYGSGLTSITIPSSVTSIGDSAFASCSSLTTITYEGGGSQITTIGKSAFSYTGFTSIQLPTGFTSIGERFYYGSSFISLTIPNNITSIGRYAFASSNKLTSVTFGANSQLTTIGEYAFNGCNKLSSIVIPNSVTSIGYMAFYAISTDASAVIDMTELDHVIRLNQELLEIERAVIAFKGTIKVSKAMESQYKTASVWQKYSAFIVGV